MFKRAIPVLVTACLFGIMGEAKSEVPSLINFNSQLSDSLGAPLDTTVSMTFTVYDAASLGNILWTETQGTVSVINGIISVLLGSVNPILDVVFNDSVRYLGIKVGIDPELTPRSRLVSVGYAHRVNTVDGSTGGQVSGNVDIQGDFTVSGKATIGPGHSSASADEGSFTFVAGQNNEFGGDWSTVSGGLNNNASDSYSAVAGGQDNFAGPWAAVGGGLRDTASGLQSYVGGGRDNYASGVQSTVSGGALNRASGDYATVAGGHSNLAGGDFATAAGGSLNDASGDFSFAAGHRAKANHAGSFVWADDTDADFLSTASNQFLIRSAFVGIGRNFTIGSEAFGIRAAVPGLSYGGMYMETESATARPFYGYATAGVAKAWHYWEGSTGKWHLYNNGSNRLTVTSTGAVGIGTESPPTNYKLAVVGRIICEELEVQLYPSWPDYVFADDYELMPLEELEKSIEANSHLPGIPTAEEVKADGLAIGEMQAKLLQKVEELTLYVIDLKKDLNRVSDENELLREQMTLQGSE